MRTGMTREEMILTLRDYAKMTEEPPTGRAIEGQEEIMRRAADMIENSVEIDRVLEIINEKETAYKDVKAEFFNTNTEKKNFDLGWVSCAKEIRWAVKELEGGENT